MQPKLRQFWQIVRQLSGEDAYERYLQDYAKRYQQHPHHGCAGPLSRQAFYRQQQDEKWNGIKRCC